MQSPGGAADSRPSGKPGRASQPHPRRGNCSEHRNEAREGVDGGQNLPVASAYFFFKLKYVAWLIPAQAEAETGASRAAVQRNLDVLEARGLAREVTGQGRFRVWAAMV